MKSIIPQATLLLSIVSVYAAGSCQDGYTICAPSGASSTTSPKIGSTEFQSLLSDLIGSSLPSFKRDASDGTASLCCIASLSCLTLSNLALPFCYDKFTTNFLLPDGSFGTIATGAYTASNGDKANLLTGEYTLAAGAGGNIYASNGAAVPNTATLALPPQFTATGVGSAVPATALGGLVTLTYTTTLPGSVLEATTISPTTIAGTTVSSVVTTSEIISTTIGTTATVTTGIVTSTEISTAQPRTVSGTTQEASTVPASTRTVVTTQAVPISSLAGNESASASPSASKKGGATQLRGLGWIGGLMVAGFVLWLQ